MITLRMGCEDAPPDVPDEAYWQGQSARQYAAEVTLPRARARAKKLNLPCDLDFAYIWGLMKDQGDVCAVSGLRFDMHRAGAANRETHYPLRPSIDRIDSTKGYVRGNVRMVSFLVNMGLGHWGDEIFIEVCRATAEKHK